ncbi:MAG TPA: 3-dehydroquinate synthase [Candidatus Polarisedimenticolia bacterium]|nr:3-dehydroquinate synthase [Candidatus Polarisedimenticolia bacterium]
MPLKSLRPRLRVRIRPSPGAECPVFIGRGILPAVAEILVRMVPAPLYFLVTDALVARLHGRRLLGRLRARGLETHLLVVPAGERSKTRANKHRLEDRMLAKGGGRDSAVLALGGGMIGDLAGFTASTYLRGIRFVTLPTTLVAMVDAAIGGKTAVDHPRGKNLIGAFHQPCAMLADVSVLETLSEGDFRSGLAEAVKTAVVGDEALFRRLERASAAILSRHPEALEDLVTACCRVKARIVQADEREAGLRSTLNFGHTLGHALEHLSRYRLRHGEAVAIGMVLEARVAEAAGILTSGESRRIEALLGRFGLPTRVPRGFAAQRILSAASSDKKSRSGEIRYALPKRIGLMARRSAGFTFPLDDRLVLSTLESAG